VICEGCNNQHAARIRVQFVEGKKWESCDQCGNVAPVWLPDVYLGNKGGIQTDENLVHPQTGKPIPFQTKREKAAIMKMLNVRQSPSAEHQHGGRNETKKGTKYFF
jgi:hypothetical protein